MSSAICLNLDQSKTLSSGNGLKVALFSKLSHSSSGKFVTPKADNTEEIMEGYWRDGKLHGHGKIRLETNFYAPAWIDRGHIFFCPVRLSVSVYSFVCLQKLSHWPYFLIGKT